MIEDYILTVNDLIKTYGEYTALDRISLKVPRGAIYGLLGPNGAGKTSLIRIINQISFPDSGQILFNQELLNKNHIHQIGYLPEERGLYKSMKVGEQALYLAKLKGMKSKHAKKELMWWFEKFDIVPWWNKKIQELSKGMAQKVQFIVTVAHRPELLILDEPFSGFDPVNANLIKDEILSLNKQGTTIIFSTHRLESVDEICNHMVLINQSKKLKEGEINTIKKESRTKDYRLAIKTEKEIELKEKMAKFGMFESVDFFSIDNELQYEIHLDKEINPNDFLSEILNYGTIVAFSEKIPTVKDIFIKAVQST